MEVTAIITNEGHFVAKQPAHLRRKGQARERTSSKEWYTHHVL